MKKFVFIISLILAFSNSSYAVDDNNSDIYSISEDLQEENFYRSPNSMMMPEVQGQEFGYDGYAFERKGGEYKDIDPDNMPLFKQIRLMVSNKVTSISNGQRKEKEQGKKFADRFKFKKKDNAEISAENTTLIPEEGSIADSIQKEISFEVPDVDTISLESGISEHVTEKELILDSEQVTYDDETGDMHAKGRPLLILPQQNTKIIADEMVYNQDSNILKGIGNVIVYKDGMPTKSDYIEIDMNEETMQMDNISANTISMIMDAEKAVHKDSLLILENGNFHSDVSQVHRLSSRMVGPRFTNMILEDDEKSLFFGDPTGNKLHFDIDKLYVEARKNHNKYVAKKINISRDGKHWLTWPSLTVYTNKDNDNFEANYPEFGTRRKLGMFAGPGFVFGGPGGSVIKAIPFLNYQDDKFGFGGMLKYKNTYNHTELGYGSAADIFFLKGHQRLDDNLFLQYSANSFMDEWFMGARMPKYMAEVYYDKRYSIPNFLAEGKGLRFRHRAGFGWMEDNDRNYYGEKIRSTGKDTVRLRYMAEVAQSLYHYENPENKFYFDFSVALQGSAAVYGTGDTQFIGRIGPRTHVQYKNWMQDIGYFQSGYDDRTPIPRYDMYRYGHSSIYIAEIVRLTKYLSVGWSGMVNLSDDSPNGKLFQENRFVFAIGPDDLKIRLGYDFVRQTTYFGFDVAFDTKGTSINYGKMVIKNPEGFNKSKKANERKFAFSPAPKQEEVQVAHKFGKSAKPAKPKTLQYAQIIDIEDPDKEVID